MVRSKSAVKHADKAKPHRQAKHDNAKQTHGQGAVNSHIPLALQQSVVNIFEKTFATLLEPSAVESTLKPMLQEVKGHLYNRDFDKAFSRQEYLDAYAARWSAGRALGYLEIFNNIFHENNLNKTTGKVLESGNSEVGPSTAGIGLSSSQENEITVLCLGGGAGAELCALAGVLQSPISPLDGFHVQAHLVDIADWSQTLNALYSTLNPDDSQSSTHSSRHIRNFENTEEQLKFEFHWSDLLEPSDAQQSAMSIHLQTASLVTLMFTLNELYSTSIPKTQAMLFDLTAKVKAGTLLLIVDSAGSYATVSVNQKETKYPMQWLVDHTLLKLAPKALGAPADTPTTNAAGGNISDGQLGIAKLTNPLWESVQSTNSRWFRVPELQYPLELENMRYQLHLYRRL